MTTAAHDVSTVENLLIREIEEETGHSGVTTSHRLFDLDIDSLTFSEVLMNLERHLGIELDLLESFETGRETTVTDLLRAITDRL